MKLLFLFYPPAKGRRFFPVAAALLLALAVSGFPYAARASAKETITSQKYVYDEDGLLSDKELADLKQLLAESSETAGADIICITARVSSYEKEKKYLEDFFDAQYDAGLLREDAALLLVNMELRDVFIQGYGLCEFYLNNDRIEYILDDITPYLSDADYAKAFSLFADEVVYYMGEEDGVSFEYGEGAQPGESYSGPGSYYQKKPTAWEAFSSLPFGLIAILSVAIGGISVAMLSASSGGSVTTDSRTYLDGVNSGIVAHRDDYIRTSVTKRRKPQESSSGSRHGSGGGRSSHGGGISSGGHSHSGGRRGF